MDYKGFVVGISLAISPGSCIYKTSRLPYLTKGPTL